MYLNKNEGVKNMIVSGVNNSSAYYYGTQNKGELNNSYKVEGGKIYKTTENKKNDIWGKLGKKYDVRNATFDEICEICGELYKAKEISNFDLAMNTLDKSRLPNLKDTSPIAKLYRGKNDWIKAFEGKAQKQLSYGNMTAYHSLMKLSQCLRNIEAQQEKST